MSSEYNNVSLTATSRDQPGSTVVFSRNQLNFFTNSKTNPAEQIFVFFSEERSVGVKTMRKQANYISHSLVVLILTSIGY